MTILLVILNVRLHDHGSPDKVTSQLHYLKSALDEGAAKRMQRLYPEGYVFTWSLYGLASAQMASVENMPSLQRAALLSEANRAVLAVRSSLARSTFTVTMKPRYGAFYASWSLYLLGNYIRAAGSEDAESKWIETFKLECERFADAVRQSDTPFLPSYHGSAWPADTAVGIAALGIHDQLFESKYKDTIGNWIRDVKMCLDPATDGVRHAANIKNGMPLGPVRGSSTALMSRVLIDAEPNFSAELYTVLRREFMDSRWYLPGVLEYPKGMHGGGDVDSGPIILGYSAPAVIVGAAAARTHGDLAAAEALFSVIELLGLPVEFNGMRYYAGGSYPVGDAFIAWAHSTPANSVKEYEPFGFWWQLPWHCASTIIILCLWLPLWYTGTKKYLRRGT